jgi:hypothetical protein
MDNQPIVWHPEAVRDDVISTMRLLQQSSLLPQFYLAGGTGLALQFGHRRSLDLDFFSNQIPDEERIIEACQRLPDFAVMAKAPQTVHAAIGSVKVSFLGYAYPVLFPPRKFLDVDVADPRDIACMKISAIANRGTKRDFVDLYVTARLYGLAALLNLFGRKFAQVRYNDVHVLKSLTYFEDAERDPDPHMLTPLPWKAVKQFFVREVPRL